MCFHKFFDVTFYRLDLSPKMNSKDILSHAFIGGMAIAMLYKEKFAAKVA